MNGLDPGTGTPVDAFEFGDRYLLVRDAGAFWARCTMTKTEVAVAKLANRA